jgi:hypothetical protein
MDRNNLALKFLRSILVPNIQTQQNNIVGPDALSLRTGSMKRSISAFNPSKILFPAAKTLPKSHHIRNLDISLPKRLRLRPHVLLVRSRQLVLLEPFLIRSIPDLKQPEMPFLGGMFEHVEEKTLRLVGNGIPDWTMNFLPFFDSIGFDVEVSEDR